jgi:tetratricopeptide (TPR) repeat protein
MARSRLSQIGATPVEALEIREEMKKGSEWLKEKKEEKALSAFLHILNRVPKNLDALENAAILSFSLGKGEEAAGYLNRILAINPNLLFAHYLLGMTHESAGRMGDAWDEMNKIVTLGEKNPAQKDVVNAKERIEEWGATRELAIEMTERLKRANRFYEKNDLVRSEKEYGAILEKVPGSFGAKFGLALIYYKQAKFSEARTLLQEVVVKDPKLLRAHFFLGKIYLREKAIQDAFNELSKVIELGKSPFYKKAYTEDIAEANRDISQMGGDVKQGQQIQNLMDSGNELMSQEDFDHAKEKFLQLLALVPGHLGALERLGTIYLRESGFEPEKAEELFKKMIQIDPGLIWPHLQLAYLYDNKGDLARSIFEYQEVIRMDREEGEFSRKARKLLVQMGETVEKAGEIRSHFQRAKLLSEANNLKEARTEYEKILEIVPGQLRALYLSALLDEEEKDLGSAEKKFRKLIEYDPEHQEGHLRLGLLLGGEGLYEEAVHELELVTALGKEGKAVMTAKSALPDLRKKVEAAASLKAGMAEIEKWEELNKQMAGVPGERPSPEKNEFLRKAVAELENAVKLNQDNPLYLYNLGYAYLLRLEVVSAEALFKRAIEKSPNLLIAHYRLAVLYGMAGANKSAKKEFEKVIELGKPEDEEVKEALLKLPTLGEKLTLEEEAKGYTLVGEFLFLEQKQKDKALPLLKRAVELAPSNGDYWYQLGVLYEALGDQDEAARSYEHSIQVSSNFSKPYFYLGLIQEKRGLGKEAYENFKKAKEYLVVQNSAEAALIQPRLDFYEKQFTSSLTYTAFNFDSNINNAGENPVTEVYATYGLSMKYFFLKSLRLLLSTDASLSNSVYYYSQQLVNSESASFEVKWPDVYKLAISAGPSIGANFAFGGMVGWNSGWRADIQEDNLMGFDAIITHIGYTYSVSVSQPSYNSVRKDLNWTLIKNQFYTGSLTLNCGGGSSEYVANDNSNIGWNIGAAYSKPLQPMLSSSFNFGLSEAYFINPDSAAAQLGQISYRRNINLSFSGGLSYILYKDLSISSSLGYQAAFTNTVVNPATDQNTLNNNLDLLTKQANSIGHYQKYTFGVSVAYSF